MTALESVNKRAAGKKRIEANHKVAFISWAPDCSRSDGIAKQFDGRSYLVYYGFWGSHPATILLKYLFQSIKTLSILFSERPSVVFVMAPPIIACFPVSLYCLLTGNKFIIDSHTAAFFYKPWSKILFLHKFFSRRALTTIVTNTFLQGLVDSWKANSTIVTDVPIGFPDPKRPDLKGKHNLTLVASFTPDEPFEPFLHAAANLPHVQFYVTGDPSEYDQEILALATENVSFTGFRPRSDYVGLLLASDAVISLTTLDHTMQRGAYEAIYLGKPVVTSDTEILRENFGTGTVHVQATADSIFNGITEMIRQLSVYEEGALELRKSKHQNWNETKKALYSLMSGGS